MGELLFYLFFATLLPLGIGLMFTIVIILEKIIWKKRNLDINSILTLDSNKISLILPNKSKSIPFNSSICINFLKIENYTAELFKWKNKKDTIPLKWKEDLDGIFISSSYKSEDVIKFGPIENFPEIFETIFCYILKWKADNGLLFSKEEILNYDSRKFDQPEIEQIKESFYQQPTVKPPSHLKICTKCGAEIEEKFNFCTKCGNKLID